ncbi:MAG: DUF805 domain-containing protein [Hyphomicrobiaceae bacterium]
MFFSPRGRLPITLYGLYAFPIMALQAGLTFYSHSPAFKDEPRPLWLLAALLVLLWMFGCVLARRLHDANYSGAVAIALVVIMGYDTATYWYPDILLGGDPDTQESSAILVDRLRLAARWMYRLTAGFALALEGYSGANAYGPPLGTLSATEQAARDQKRRKRLAEEFGDRLPASYQAAAAAAGPALAQHAGLRRISRTLQASSPTLNEEAVAVQSRPRRAGFGRR